MTTKLVYLFDTNIITSKTFADVERLPKGQFFSGVVYTEVMTAADPKPFRAYSETWKQAAKEARLILPTDADWLISTRILHRLAQDRKRDAGGRSAGRTSAAKQELLADVLIASSAAREGVAVVTDDGDFQAIKRYLKSLRVMTPSDFLE
jgi:predicted nucleic acid-binding protein